MALGKVQAEFTFHERPKTHALSTEQACGQLRIEDALRDQPDLPHARQVLRRGVEYPGCVVQCFRERHQVVEGGGVDEPGAASTSVELHEIRTLPVFEARCPLGVHRHGAVSLHEGLDRQAHAFGSRHDLWEALEQLHGVKGLRREKIEGVARRVGRRVHAGDSGGPARLHECRNPGGQWKESRRLRQRGGPGLRLETYVVGIAERGPGGPDLDGPRHITLAQCSEGFAHHAGHGPAEGSTRSALRLESLQEPGPGDAREKGIGRQIGLQRGAEEDHGTKMALPRIDSVGIMEEDEPA